MSGFLFIVVEDVGTRHPTALVKSPASPYKKKQFLRDPRGSSPDVPPDVHTEKKNHLNHFFPIKKKQISMKMVAEHVPTLLPAEDFP